MRDKITVLIPSSPIPSHPGTEVIDKTISSVREHLADVEILIMLDGVRPEQEHRRAQYEEYKQRLLGASLPNVLPIVYQEHLHQAEMTRRTLEHVQTPLILFMEHDTFFTGAIDWQAIADVVYSGALSMVGFYCMLQPWIHPEHRWLALDCDRRYYEPAHLPVVRTWQWSQRPHVASVAFYRHILSTYFDCMSRTMIEDRMHGVLLDDRARHGDTAWENWKLAYYAPEGDINRSHTVDGRQGDPKFDMRF